MKSGCKLVGVRRRWALISAAAAVGLPVVGTAIPALGDISITFGPGSTQMFLPQTGTYTLEVAGAQGGSNGPVLAGGYGAIVEGTTANFTSRDSLSFYVGAQGVGTTDFILGAGGGGGSFLYDNTTSSLLVAAGGGGGEGGGNNGGIGQTTNAGAAGSSGMGDTGGTAGTGGNGGQAGSTGDGAGGGGFLTAGQGTSGFGVTATGGGGFSGLAGGTTTETPSINQVTGGYGGGGAAGIEGGGGGGGYSGGGGGGGNAGGGGGSFIASSITGSSSLAGNNALNGFIIFSPTTFNLTIAYGATGTIAGAISGGGAVIMAGTGNPILTSTSNSWTGGTTISSGTFTVGDGGADGSLPGNVANSAKLVFNSSSSLVVSGNISGTGTLTQSGSGTLVLTGTNSYTGLTTVSAGTLQLGNNSSNGLIPGNITDNAAVVMNFSGADTYAGIISGTGSFATAGSGVVYLNNQSTYNGSTTVGNTALLTEINNAIPVTTSLIDSGGNFVIGAGGASPVTQTVASLSGSGDISGGVANATFTLNQSGNTVYSGNFQQSGGSTLSFTKQGGGTLILTGTSTYAGSTTISAGSLQYGNGGTTGSITTNITDNANLTFDRTDSFTYGGNITGSGSLTPAGAGTVALTGANSYNGGTTISAGSLQIGSGGSTGSITGNVTDNANLTFDLTTNPTISSKISGSGSLTQSGSGNVTLTSSNTYAGNTTINAGVLIAGVTNALPTTTNLIMNSGYLGLNTNVTQTVASLSGAGSGIGMSPNGILTVNQSANTEFDGTIYDENLFGGFGSSSDTGQLIKQGTGRLTLTGSSVYGGGTTISGGTLQIGNGGTAGSIAGNILDNASLVYDLSGATYYPYVISGTGALTQKGSGTLILSGTNTYTGGTTINTGGTLQLGNDGTLGSLSSTGAILDNGNITFYRSDSFTFGSYIHGAGSLTQADSGTVNLTTSNSYTGTTNVTAGKLIISATNGLAESPVSLSGGSVLQLAQNTGEEDITALTIAVGQFDIGNNHLFIDYGSGPDPIASIAALIKSGYNNGAWNAGGIISTNAQTNGASYGIGYADSADPGNPAGLSSGQIEIKYTLLGDANLDGAVNGSDFAILAANFNKADLAGHSGWSEGDFNYDGSINGADFAALAANFNKGASQASDQALTSFASANGLMADVPEPATSSLLLITGAGIFLRRRRKQLS